MKTPAVREQFLRTVPVKYLGRESKKFDKWLRDQKKGSMFNLSQITRVEIVSARRKVYAQDLNSSGVGISALGCTLTLDFEDPDIEIKNERIPQMLARHTFTIQDSAQPIKCQCGIEFKYSADYSEHLARVLA